MSRKSTNQPVQRSMVSRIALLSLTLIVVVASFAPMALAGGGNWGG